MRLPVPKTIFTAHAVAWLYLAGFVLAEVIYAGLSPRDQAAITTWASTNVHNLSHDPLGSLIASAFVTGAFVTAGAGSVLVWRQRARALSKDPAGAGQPG